MAELSNRRRFTVVGGAGFIGSHFVDRLLSDRAITDVTVYDNFSSGREWHLAAHTGDPRLRVIEGDVVDMPLLTQALDGTDVVIHLASNPDIARAMVDPSIDFNQGTVLTHNVVEASRQGHVTQILYASGSGVYGDLGEFEPDEDYGPLIPISTYGASKLAGEALISSYCYMFGVSGLCFRFGNVVGPRQTHGVGFDFTRSLLKDPDVLTVQGDGLQSKSYIHVHDVVDAVLTASKSNPRGFACYNVATGDYITVREIAELATEVIGGPAPEIRYTGGSRGWKGDVPVVRLDTARIRSLGWTNRRSSRQALQASLESLVADARSGLLG